MGLGFRIQALRELRIEGLQKGCYEGGSYKRVLLTASLIYKGCHKGIGDCEGGDLGLDPAWQSLRHGELSGVRVVSVGIQGFRV